MTKLIAPCGLDCTACDAYIATQANDMVKLTAMAEHAKKEYGMDITPEATMCDGCTSDSVRKIGYCKECKVLACARGKNMANCAVCPDYGCEIITAFTAIAPKAKEALEKLRNQC
jgi:hypothetical protein